MSKIVRPGDVFHIRYSANGGRASTWIALVLRLRRQQTTWNEKEWEVLVLSDPLDNEEGLIIFWPEDELLNSKRIK